MKIIALAVACCFSVIAIAQPMPQTPALDSIWRTLDLENVVVTAQYAPTHISNAVHHVRVLQGEAMQQQGQNTLAEVLANQLNLRVSADPALGNGISIQGIGGENVQIMIDGVPIIGRTNGNIDLSQINLNNVERIEIIEGAMSAQYGSNAAGGVINIITKKTQLHRFQVQSQNQYENIGIQQNALTVGFRQKKWFASVNGYRFNSRFLPTDSLRIFQTITLEDGQTYRAKRHPWNPKLQHGINGTLTYSPSDSTKFTYQYRFFDETLDNYGEVRRPQFQPYTFDEFFTTQRTDHSLQAETYLNNRWYLNTTTAYNRFDRLKRTERLDVLADTVRLVEGGQDTATFTALLHRSTLNYLSDGKISGQFGVEILYETGAGERLQAQGATLANYAAWLSLQYQPTNRLTVQGNLRYGYNTKYAHPIVPSLHLNWSPHDAWNIKLSYANGFRSPSLKELYFNFVDVNHYIVGNPDLKAEYSQNIALNVQHDRKWGAAHHLSLQGRFFYNNIKNRIVLAEFEPLKFNYQNLATFETHGSNLIADYRYGKRLSLKAGFALTRLLNEFAADTDAPRFTNLSELQNELNYKIPKIETHLAVTHRFIGQQVRFYEDSNGTLQQGFVGAHHFLNATVSRSFWEKRLFVAVGCKNLLNVQTVPLSGNSNAAHSAVGDSQLINWGRTYFVRLNVEFGG